MRMLYAVPFVTVSVLWCNFASAETVTYGGVEVYTRNVYVGTDLSALAGADPSNIDQAVRVLLQNVAQTNFPVRAKALAAEITHAKPQLIGLQEVADFRLNGGHGPLPFRDYLEDLLTALAAQGAAYDVAAVVTNTTLSLPLDFDADGHTDEVGFSDRDVILVRRGIVSSPARFPCKFPSGDGCHYETNLTAPAQGITLLRGYSGVDVRLKGRLFRFVNTHLEVSGRVAGVDISGIQILQARELLSILETSTPEKRPIILVGDFNSGPTDGDAAPYVQTQIAGYRDTWKVNLLRFLNPEGFTCCQLPTLTNRESLLNQRIDLILVRNRPARTAPSRTGPVLGAIIGDRPLGLEQPNWSSDHAGPVVSMPLMPLFEEELVGAR